MVKRGYQIPPRIQYVETLPPELPDVHKSLDEERENLKVNGTESIESISSTIPDS